MKSTPRFPYVAIGLIMILARAPWVYSETISLRIPIVEDTPQQHLYFHELLETALRNSGNTPVFQTETLPQLRIKFYLESSDISIYWMLASKERNEKFIPVHVGLTNGLIGKRILFIKKGDQSRFNGINTLDDLRKINLVAGLGKKWLDIDVWRANQLPFREHDGNWKSIFPMLAIGRGYDYFPRGINEIIVESKQYSNLDIENRLVLIYEGDFLFYLSQADRKYQAIIEEAMTKAKADGLIDALIQKYWGEDLKTLQYEDRLKLHLKSPQ